MFEPLLTQPQILDFESDLIIRLILPENMGEFSLLQLLGGPLAEVVVVKMSAAKLTVMLRLHPFLRLQTDAEIAHALPHFDNSDEIIRSVGQGWRLFATLGASPTLCASQLRGGVKIKLCFDTLAAFSIENNKKWELVPLEKDLRLSHRPREITLAKAILARSLDDKLTPESLIVEISELETVRRELFAFANRPDERLHSRVEAEISTLDAQLLSKRQWLSRHYNQSAERASWRHAANENESNEKLTRMLECYQLLATPELNQMVKHLVEDDNEE